MTIYDAAMALVVVAGMVRGAWRGFTWQAASIASLILGYISARSLSGQLAPSFPGQPEVQRALAMAVIYLAVSGGIFGIAWMVRSTIRKLKFDAYDRHLGMVLGAFEGAGVGLLLTLFVVSLAPGTRQPIFTSPSGRAAGTVMDHLGPVLPSEIRQALASHWGAEAAAAPSVAAAEAEGNQATAAPGKPSVAEATGGADLPAIEEAASEPGTAHGPSSLADLPPLEAPPENGARGGGQDLVQSPAPSPGSTSDNVSLDQLVERTRRNVEQAVAESLDTTDGPKAKNLRQLANKERQRIQGAVTDAIGKKSQKLSHQLRGRLDQGQQSLEKAVDASISKAKRVERAVSDSVDQQLQELGGLEVAPQRGPQ
jgi:membrane protein required for colicin V production